MSAPAPIALFVYNRIEPLRETVNALLENQLADQTELIVFSDGPKSAKENDTVEAVRLYIKEISGFKKVSLRIKEKNTGLAASIISGVTELVNQYGKVIVVEDDIVTSKYFLKYMNDALDLYQDDLSVCSIGGFSVPVKAPFSTYFSPAIFCWGWATWKNRWEAFNPDGEYLYRTLKAKKLEKIMNAHSSFIISGMSILKKQIAGRVNSWAVRWHASNVLLGRFMLCPSVTLVNNIGIGDTRATHCRCSSNKLTSPLANAPVELTRQEIKADPGILKQIKRFYLRVHLDLLKSFFQIKLKNIFSK